MNCLLMLVSRVGTFRRMSDSIAEVIYNGINDATLEEIKEFTLGINKIMDHQPYFLINIVGENLGSFSPEIWHYLAISKDANTYIKGSAVVTKSLGYKLQVNLFFKKYKPLYHKTILETKEEAYIWIDTINRLVSNKRIHNV